jgi:hypothetical protein
MIIAECKMEYITEVGYCIYWKLLYNSTGEWGALDLEELGIPKLNIN